MRTNTSSARITSALRKRIRLFYDHLNRADFDWCYHALDPAVRESPASVTPHQHSTSLERFLNRYGPVNVLRIDPIQLHLNEQNRLYNNRDFALVEVAWEDRLGESHTFRERWVRDARGRWYTRCTGLAVPET